MFEKKDLSLPQSLLVTTPRVHASFLIFLLSIQIYTPIVHGGYWLRKNANFGKFYPFLSHQHTWILV